MERLIETADEYAKKYARVRYDRETVMDFADYLISTGLIVLPCKPGDMVYRIVQCGWRNVDIRERKVTSVEYNAAGEWIIHSTGSDVLGDTVFLTREEAEKALKEEPT